MRCPFGKMVFTNFCSIVRKDMLGKCSGLNLVFVATSNILSPLSYEMSARSHPAMNSANDLEKLAGPRMRSACPLPPSQMRKSFWGCGKAATGNLARHAAAALLYASGPACSAAHNLPIKRDGSNGGAAGGGGLWAGGGTRCGCGGRSELAPPEGRV